MGLHTDMLLKTTSAKLARIPELETENERLRAENATLRAALSHIQELADEALRIMDMGDLWQIEADARAALEGGK